MEAWPGQYCINVTDLERIRRVLRGARPRDAPAAPRSRQALEAIVEHPEQGGSKLQLAQQKEPAGAVRPRQRPLEALPQHATTSPALYAAALADGRARCSPSPDAARSSGRSKIAFVQDPDGYLVELVQRHPWPDDDATRRAVARPVLHQRHRPRRHVRLLRGCWASTCTSRTEIATALEAILGAARQGRQDPAGPTEGPARAPSSWASPSGSSTCTPTTGVAAPAAVDAGHASVLAPMFLDRWPTTIAFVADPDGYQVELVSVTPVTG